jgi:hypothetical protein
MQVLILGDRRNFDPSIAGLGTGKAQRYFASDFDRLSDCLFDTSEIAVVEVADASVQQRGTACAQPVRQCSTGSSRDQPKRITSRNQKWFNQLKRKENALAL